MTSRSLYRGVWPQNVSRLAKYAVRIVDGCWQVTVLYDAGDGLTFLAVEGTVADLVERTNELRASLGNPPGGPFYINEFRHVIVPIAASKGMGTGSVYYSCGRFDGDLKFEYEGRMLVTRPVDADGKALTPGTQWLGPRPGIPYVLSAGGSDIHYETPALTDTDPPDVRPNMTRRVQLGRVLGDRSLAARAAHPVAAVRGSLGGRFYVNEYGAMFTPVGRDDGTGLQYIYCGQIDTSAWFPEPPLG